MTIPSEPPWPEMAAYKRAFDAALYGNPERAARLAELERAFQAAAADAEIRAAGSKIGDLLDEVFVELSPDWPQVRSGRPRKPE